MVCLPSVTGSGNMIFGKNSDRSPNEPHIIERFPAADYDIAANPTVRATYIDVEQAAHTYAVTLFKPSWIWGAEMGFNEFGVNIGNEAVFTKEKKGGDALLGMDLLRLALERAKTALEAMNVIIELLSKYGQGGNCGYQKKFYYDNSYLIADRKDAYVLETAGKFWAAVKVKDIYAISNNLTIEGDFDYAHPEVLKAREDNPDYSFADTFREPVFTFFAQSKGRREMAEAILKAESGKVTVQTVAKVLRSHKSDQKDIASVGSVCMHAGGLIGDHTTGAYIAELGAKDEIYYATGASLPCMSVFKPMTRKHIEGDLTGKGVPYWFEREMLIRHFLAGQADRESFCLERDNLEKEIFEKSYKLKNKEQADFIREITKKEQDLVDRYLAPLKDTKHDFRLGKGFYRSFWRKKTEKLIGDNKIK
mgnify:CR=1 FL=1